MRAVSAFMSCNPHLHEVPRKDEMVQVVSTRYRKYEMGRNFPEMSGWLGKSGGVARSTSRTSPTQPIFLLYCSFDLQ